MTNVILILLGGALVKITTTGTYLRYVKPTTQPYIIAAGIIMIALSVATIIHDLARVERSPGNHPATTWLLLLPVLAVLLMAPPPLGADAVLRDGNRTAPPVAATAFPALPATGVIQLPLTQAVTRAVWDKSHALTGRTITLTGFTVHANGTTYMARLVITCCAADATPMRMALTGTAANQLPDNQWIRATGELAPNSATEQNGYTPTLDATTLTPIQAPADPYEY